jgi:multiple sugar transport system permease protein
MGRHGTRRILQNVVIYVIIAVALTWALLPIIWMFLSSLKTQVQAFEMPPRFIFTPSFASYKDLFVQGNFGAYLRNSVIASLVSVFFALLLGVPGGYALVRGGFRQKEGIAFWIISQRMTPIAAAIVPLYMMFSRLDLISTLPGLIIAYSTFNLPFAFWLMMTFFEDLPVETEEAALVDGCTWIGAFWNVALPQARPGLVATGVLALVFAWNDFAFATAFTSAGTQTVPIAASLLISQQGIKWGQAMAIGTMIITPMLAAGILVRKHLVRGLSMGAVK